MARIGDFLRGLFAPKAKREDPVEGAAEKILAEFIGNPVFQKGRRLTGELFGWKLDQFDRTFVTYVLTLRASGKMHDWNADVEDALRQLKTPEADLVEARTSFIHAVLHRVFLQAMTERKGRR